MKTLLITLLLTIIGLPLYAAEPGMVRFVYMQGHATGLLV